MVVIRLAAALFIALFSLSTVSAQEGALAARVTGFQEAFAAAWQDGDPDAFLALWSDDPAFYPPDGAALRGRGEIRTWFATLGATSELEITPISIEAIEGGGALVIGEFAQELVYKGKELGFRGGYVGLLQDTENGPRMHRLVSFPERKMAEPSQ